jgi:probable rRNA maturation factor
MNDVQISAEGIEAPEWLPAAAAFALRVLGALGVDGWDLSLLVCDDPFIRELNRRYRDKDEATDVLSFEQGDHYRGPEGEERFLAGDIVISLGGLSRNVADFGVGKDEELRRLVIHGILHLSGLDHEGNDPSEPMLARQEDLLAALGGEAIL